MMVRWLQMSTNIQMQSLKVNPSIKGKVQWLKVKSHKNLTK